MPIYWLVGRDISGFVLFPSLTLDETGVSLSGENKLCWQVLLDLFFCWTSCQIFSVTQKGFVLILRFDAFLISKLSLYPQFYDFAQMPSLSAALPTELLFPEKKTGANFDSISDRICFFSFKYKNNICQHKTLRNTAKTGMFINIDDFFVIVRFVTLHCVE